MKLSVKEVCKEKGLTIQDLADKMEMKRESLSRAINGNPTLETLEKIASALEVDITELFWTFFFRWYYWSDPHKRYQLQYK